jgi:hypothetical protein
MTNEPIPHQRAWDRASHHDGVKDACGTAGVPWRPLLRLHRYHGDVLQELGMYTTRSYISTGHAMSRGSRSPSLSPAIKWSQLPLAVSRRRTPPFSASLTCRLDLLLDWITNQGSAGYIYPHLEDDLSISPERYHGKPSGPWRGGGTNFVPACQHGKKRGRKPPWRPARPHKNSTPDGVREQRRNSPC